MIVVKNPDSSLLWREEVVLDDFHFINDCLRKPIIKGKAKLRSTQPLKKAKLVLKNKKAEIVFERKVHAVTPEQFGVFYLKDICLGGGKICS